ncbi:short-chain dehydrogenase/reductase [Purpureocillium lavendulum]|uniref:Short-chain dehydrogenase/reductase n=1 Tax=Purpureocillium lavendulum TaxID=1247861 RepID=A0AB34FQ55_9HYPO|nr:short-chain dehydrogenase/reductase [Purpureocillium lavendulum]
MSSSPRRKTVLITGGSAGGIGSALAQAFHDQGCRVFATARDLHKVEHLKAIGISVLRLDVEDTASISNAATDVAAATVGTLDILVNNSGLGQAGPILDSDLDFSRKMFEVNFFGRVATTQAFAPLLIQAKGTVLNIGSIAGVCPQPWKGMYNASCAAVHQWSDTLRIEMEPFGVRVILVVTGAVRTNFLTNQPSVELSPRSIYAPAKASIEAVMNGTAVAKNFVDADAYARAVVANALRESPVKRQWAGGVATLIWAVSAFLWATSWDFLLAGQFAIKDLRRNLASKSGKTL